MGAQNYRFESVAACSLSMAITSRRASSASMSVAMKKYPLVARSRSPLVAN